MMLEREGRIELARQLFRLPADAVARSIWRAGTRWTSSPTADDRSAPDEDRKQRGRGPRRRDGRGACARARGGCSCTPGAADRDPGAGGRHPDLDRLPHRHVGRRARGRARAARSAWTSPCSTARTPTGRSFVIGAQGAVRDPATGQFPPERPGAEAEPRRPQGDRDDRRRAAPTTRPAETVTIGPNVRISDGGSGFTLVTPEAVVDTAHRHRDRQQGRPGHGPAWNHHRFVLCHL